ncbi:MAG: methyltransferase [Pontixanthobacter sp.]
MQLAPARTLLIGDWSERLSRHFQSFGARTDIGRIGYFDEERPFATAQYDLIVHCLGLGTVNDLPGALLHTHEALTKDGVFIATFPGAGSIARLRQIMIQADGEHPAPRMHPLIDRNAAAGLLQRAGFRRQVVDSHSMTVRYSNLMQLVGDLRDHGLTSSLSVASMPFGKRQLTEAQRIFAEMADGGKLTERFEMLTMTGWK